MKNDKLTASEIGSYCTCARAWSYQRRGFAPENQSALAAGTRYHRQYGQKLSFFHAVRMVLIALLILVILTFALNHFGVIRL